MNEDVIKIIETSKGVEILGGNKVISLPKTPYKEVKDMFTNVLLDQKHEILKEAIFDKLKKDHSKKGKIAKHKYSLGNKILLIENCCEKCLALQYPFGSNEEYVIPEEFDEIYYDEDKLFTLDEKGIVEVRNAGNIAHAKCCPLRCNRLLPNEMPKEESMVNESYLEWELISEIVDNKQFILKDIWELSADIFGERFVFYGLNKKAAIEKLFRFVLKNYYNYSGFGIGFTTKSACLDYISQAEKIKCEDINWTEVNLEHNETYKLLKLEGELLKARYVTCKDFFETKYIELITKSGKYTTVGSTIEDCLLDLWIKLKKKEYYNCNNPKVKDTSFDIKEQPFELKVYEDALSTRYKFIILGGDNSV
ncbi:hypothetical protein [Clostridium manihotivorum]|uniref:Uncharacterized protein n=1 Tax=Clostridium manihotivorum TaxID=2320868 RepID=A0A410DPL7_9CLOT|nr:hypothetical protein [Clostridium manihotivorum]QAA31113.1 hypothetical protein C1I91_05230 [Clostridium manihotivorum]